MIYFLATFLPPFAMFSNGSLSSVIVNLFIVALCVVLGLMVQLLLVGSSAYARCLAQQERQHREILAASREHGFLGYPH